MSPCSARQKDRPECRYRATRHDRPPIFLKESVGPRMCGLQRLSVSVQPSGQVASSPSAPTRSGLRSRLSAALMARRRHRGGRTRCGSQHCMLDDSARKPGSTCWSALTTLAIDIVALFTLYHCYGGAPREVPFATGQAAPQGAEVAPRTRDKTKRVPCRRSIHPSVGVQWIAGVARLQRVRPLKHWRKAGAKRKDKPGRRNASRERRSLRCLTS